MVLKLDAIDVKILRLLQEDARMPVAEIAKLLRLSRPTVKARIDKLKESGVISRFTVEISRDALEKPVVVLLRMKAGEEAVELLRDLPEVVEVYSLTGEKNLFCKALVKDIDDVGRLVNTLRGVAESLEAEVVTGVLKESEPPVEMIKAELTCEYCGSAISKPHVYKFRNVERYFCCPICLKSYKRQVALATKEER
jgi:Lrp/AsnC family transcriptional regulator for asnA, asnC and gidA